MKHNYQHDSWYNSLPQVRSMGSEHHRMYLLHRVLFRQLHFSLLYVENWWKLIRMISHLKCQPSGARIMLTRLPTNWPDKPSVEVEYPAKDWWSMRFREQYIPKSKKRDEVAKKGPQWWTALPYFLVLHEHYFICFWVCSILYYFSPSTFDLISTALLFFFPPFSEVTYSFENFQDLSKSSAVYIPLMSHDL